jgi:hypothetical protein
LEEGIRFGRALPSGARRVEIESESGDNQGSFSGKARKRWIFTVAWRDPDFNLAHRSRNPSNDRSNR